MFKSITFFGNGEQNCKFNIHVTFDPVLALLPLLGVLLAPDVSLEDGLVGAGHVAVLAEELLRLLVPHLLPVTLALRAHRIKIFQNVEKYFKIFHRAKKYMCSSAQNSPACGPPNSVWCRDTRRYTPRRSSHCSRYPQPSASAETASDSASAPPSSAT